MIVEDPIPMRKTFVHWVLYGIPATTTRLTEGIPTGEERAGGFVHGTNDYGYLGWGGPLPPVGESHRYWFWIYALDTNLRLEPGATKDDVLAAMAHHILTNGRIVGLYRR